MTVYTKCASIYYLKTQIKKKNLINHTLFSIYIQWVFINTFLIIFNLYGSNLAIERSSGSDVKRNRFIRTAALTTIITNRNFLRALNDAVFNCWNHMNEKRVISRIIIKFHKFMQQGQNFDSTYVTISWHLEIDVLLNKHRPLESGDHNSQTCALMHEWYQYMEKLTEHIKGYFWWVVV